MRNPRFQLRREMHLAESQYAASPEISGLLSSPSKFSGVLAFLPVLSAILYLLGRAYEESYLFTLGIDPSLFPQGVENVLVAGFVALWVTGVPWLSYVLLVAEIFLLFAITAAFLASPRWIFSLTDRIKALQSGSNKPVWGKWQEIAWNFFLIVGIVFFVAGAMGGVIVAAGKQGERKAEKQLGQMQSGRPTSIITIVLEGKEAVEGTVLQVSENYFAYYSDQAVNVVPASAVIRLQRNLTPPKSEAARLPSTAAPAAAPLP